MKCVIHGSGGVGGYYGGCLARAGHEVFFIARGAHLEAIQQQGLSIKSAKGDFRIETPKSGERCDPNFDPDLVIVAVKSWQLPEITEEIKNYCTPSTLILPLQNGADASDIFADVDLLSLSDYEDLPDELNQHFPGFRNAAKNSIRCSGNRPNPAGGNKNQHLPPKLFLDIDKRFCINSRS